MSHQVYICRVRSTYVAPSLHMSREKNFPWACRFCIDVVSPPSLMGCGQLNYGLFTDLLRPFFTFGYSLSESHGFSGPGPSHLNSDAIVARDGRPQGAPLPIQAASGGFVPLRCICPCLGQVGSSQVDLSRSRSIQVDVISFFWTYVLDFANGSSPSLMGYGQLKYGQFADLQWPSFAFGLSLGASYGFSGPGQTHLNSDAIAAHEGRPQGAPLPIRAEARGFGPIRCSYPWLGRVSTCNVVL